MFEKKHCARDILFVFLLGMVLFCTVNFSGEFVQFKCRFGLFAREMMLHGVSPYATAYGKPYPDYPSGQTILIWALSLLFGKVSYFTSVFPTAMAAALTLCLIYLIGLIHSRRLAAYAVLFELGTFFFFSAARTPSLDHFVTTVSAFCFYIAYSSDIYNARKRLWLLPVALIAGFVFRGPIGLIIPTSVVWVYYLVVKDLRKLLWFSLYTSALLILCSGVLLYLGYLQGGREFVDHVLNMQASGRLVNARRKPLYYYLVRGMGAYAITFPVFILVLTAYWKKLWQKDTDSYAVFFKALAGWVIIILVGLSIPAAKKTRYILPIAPALSLGAAYLFLDVHKSDFLRTFRSVLVKLCRLAPFLCTLLAVIGYFILKADFVAQALLKKRVSLETSIVSSPLPLLLFALLGIATIFMAKKLINEKSREFAFFAVGISCFVIVHIFIVEPINLAFESTKPFLEKVEPFRPKKNSLAFYRVGPDGDDVKYVVNLKKILTPKFMLNPQEILQLEQGEVVITREDDFSTLPEFILKKIEKITDGKIGHHIYVAFKIKK